jgi:uncharacterized membrane protein YagU involved in acid resistance
MSDQRTPALQESESIELPRPTVWPLVLAAGIGLIGLGLATNYVIAGVGVLLFLSGLTGWVADLLPGRGHGHAPLVEAAYGRAALQPGLERSNSFRPGMAGYRFRVPEKVHPISSGLKGGLVGGLFMPIPAIAYGVVSGHGIWFPVNLLAGMVIPGISGATPEQLEHFHPVAFVVACIIHVSFSGGFGLLFGVVSPTLPPMPGGPVIAGGVLMPLLWSGLCYGSMGVVNPVLEQNVNWPWFVVSQIVYGLVMSIVVWRSVKILVTPLQGIDEPPGERI